MTANVNVTKLLFKRGNTVQNANYTGINGEITVDTQAKTLRIHDGVTAGGNVITAGGVVGAYSNTNAAAYIPTDPTITSLQSNAATQSIAINTVNANIGAFQTYANITLSTVANAASQESAINSINANIGAYQIFANTNATSQTTEINSLRANITAANTAISSLQSNAAVQAALLDTLTGNAASQSQVLDTLTTNAATQATTLTTLLSNAVAQQTSLIDLVANAAIQAQAIANASGTYGNANVAAYLGAFDGNIIPTANVTYSLGSEQFQWKDLWVSNNTIYIGNTPIQIGDGQLFVGGNAVADSIANLTNGSHTIQLMANGVMAMANGTQIRDIGTAGTSGLALGNHGFQVDFGSAVNDWALFSGANLVQITAGNSFSIVAGPDAESGQTWSFDTNGNINLPVNGKIWNVNTISTPEIFEGNTSSMTISAGSTTIGNAGGLTISAGDTVTGSAGPLNINAGSTVSGDTPGLAITAGSTVTGNVAALAIYGGGTVTGDAGPITILAGTAVTGRGGDIVLLAGNTVTGNAGAVSITGGETITGSGGDIVITGGASFSDAANNDHGGDVVIAGGFSQLGTGGNVTLRTGTSVTGSAGNIKLESGDGSLTLSTGNATVYNWNYSTDGNLIINRSTPHGGIDRGIEWDWGLGQAALGLGAGEGSNSYIRQTGNGLEIHPNGPGDLGDGDLRIRTGNVSPSGISYDWIFNGTGRLTFPTGGNLTFDSSAVSIIDGVTDINAVGTIGANVVQVLYGLTSFGASPAPVIWGFSSISTTGSAVNEGNISASGNLVASQNAYVNGAVQAGRMTTGNLTVTGNLTQQSAYYETYANVTNSGGNLTCNFVNGGTFYATLTANVTANFTNVALTTGTIIGATIIVDQGATPYQISNVQVNGGGIQTVKWAGGVGQNPGTGSNTDVMSFSLINLGGGAWRVLGAISNYG